MSDHPYIRAQLADGQWDIDKRQAAKAVEAAFPGEPFRFRATGPACVFAFDADLDQAQSDALDAVVVGARAAQVAGELDRYKLAKMAQVDIRTNELIGQGFQLSGKTHSTSAEAQRYWAGLQAGQALLSAPDFPLRVNTKDDLDAQDIVDVPGVNAAFGAIMGTVKAHLASGTALKDLIRAAVDIAGVDAVQDNR